MPNPRFYDTPTTVVNCIPSFVVKNLSLFSKEIDLSNPTAERLDQFYWSSIGKPIARDRRLLLYCFLKDLCRHRERKKDDVMKFHAKPMIEPEGVQTQQYRIR